MQFLLTSPLRLLPVLGLAVLAGCATGPDGTRETRNTGTGAAVGAVVGGISGALLDRGSKVRGAAIGTAAGAAVGGGIGHLFDRQQQEFEQVLAEERQANAVQVERVRDDLLKLTLENEVSFDFDSAAIKPTFRPTLEKLADVLTKHDRTRVTVVGHTDSVGSEAYNQRLSERRAEAVRARLASLGVARSRLEAEGRGELEPRATNETEAGRQLNRRVEILVRPREA